MAIYDGSTKINKVYYGNTPVKKVYHGDNLVYSTQGVLYMIDNTNDLLLSVDPNTGIAENLGSLSGFGNGNNFDVTGCSLLGSTLYAVEFRQDDALFRLNLTLRRAHRVGTAARFGINEASPRGLASLDNSLYMVGSSSAPIGQRVVPTGNLYELDVNTGIASKRGSDQNFSVGETLPQCLGSVGKKLYMCGVNNRNLYELDPNTAEGKRIGTAEDFGDVNINDPVGMAGVVDRLLMVTTDDARSDALYEMNLTTGVAEQVGDATNFGINQPNIQPDTLFYIP